MVFNSIAFLIFFILFLPLYFAFPAGKKWVFLLLAGYFYYGYQKPVNLLFLIIPTLVVFFVSQRMASVKKEAASQTQEEPGNITDKKQNTEKKRTRPIILLIIALFSGLILLLIFKYTDFIRSTLYFLQNLFIENPAPFKPVNLILPMGISFYSFKLVSYIIDVYNEKLEPERHLGYFALYVSFFPQILAGPIDRAVNLLPQLKKKVSFDYERVSHGFQLILWGFFKKIVIADTLSHGVTRVYNNVESFEGIPLLAATLFYSVQIYCDFSGYSDIAIGIAEVLGFKSMENFDSPYFSKDIKQFWNKWHISLSTWLRDYLFLPIAYAVMRRIHSAKLLKIKTEAWGYIVGMSITMFLGGLWHGASWTFVFWGVIHGLYLVLSHTTRRIRKRFVKTLRLNKIPWLYHGIKVLITFNIVTLAWIFFRSKSISDAFYVLSHLFTGIGEQLTGSELLETLKQTLRFKEFDLVIIAISIFVLGSIDFIQTKRSIRTIIAGRPLWIRWGLYCLLIYFILWFGEFDKSIFIYFQF